MSNNISNNKNELALTPDNYVGEVQDIQARQAIEALGNAMQTNNNTMSTIQSLLYGGIVTHEQLKQEVALQQKESEKNILAVVDNKIDSKIEERGLTKQESKNLDKARKQKVSQFLGNSIIKGIKNPKYILFSGYMFGVIKGKIKNKFNIEDYTDIKPHQYLDILHFIKYDIVLTDDMLVNAVKKLRELYSRDILGIGYMNPEIKKYYENVFVNKTMTIQYPFVKESNSDNSNNAFVDSTDINNI